MKCERKNTWIKICTKSHPPGHSVPLQFRAGPDENPVKIQSNTVWIPLIVMSGFTFPSNDILFRVPSQMVLLRCHLDLIPQLMSLCVTLFTHDGGKKESKKFASPNRTILFIFLGEFCLVRLVRLFSSNAWSSVKQMGIISMEVQFVTFPSYVSMEIISIQFLIILLLQGIVLHGVTNCP